MSTPQQPYNQSIFWVETEKIRPNPYQPRKEFDEAALRDLADSIRQYGVLQPLVVTRHEEQGEDGGLRAYYELIAGERRLRASTIAGVQQIPVIIREGTTTEESEQVKLELAIIENVQREDLNAVERGRAFKRLVDEFKFKHAHIAKKIGKSREYVANSIRILTLPEEVLNALAEKKISEGHTRPLLMLGDKKDEQTTLFREILYKQLNVRESERIARSIAHDKARKRDLNPEMRELAERLTGSLGTRVQIEPREKGGGRLTITFASVEELQGLLDVVEEENKTPAETASSGENTERHEASEENAADTTAHENHTPQGADESAGSTEQKEKHPEVSEDPDLYSVSNFTI